MASIGDDRGHTVVDPNVLSALPDVAKVLNSEHVVQSRRARGIRIDVQTADGNEESYFMKISQGHHGREAIKGEFEATSAIHTVTTDFCPKPIAWGTFAANPDAHFYLCKFYKFVEGIPDGQSEELECLLPTLFDKVIPRLLRPLRISSALIHGDLWYGNASVLKESGLKKEAIVYDPASFYGHNEYELGNWRPERNRFTKEYFDAYHSHVPKSEPVGDYDDRIKLYEMRFNLNAAALFLDDPQFLRMVTESIRELYGKFRDSEI